MGSYNARAGIAVIAAIFALTVYGAVLPNNRVQSVDPSLAVPQSSRAGEPFDGGFTVAAPRRLSVLQADLDDVLARYSGGALNGDTVRSRNLALHARLASAWSGASREQEASGVGELDAFERAVGHELDNVFNAALGSGDDQFVTDHARFFESRLRWAARGSTEDCADVLAGRGDLSEDFRTYRGKLVVRAVLSGAEPRSNGRPASTARVPVALFDDALKRSGLSRTAFRDAIRDRGTSAARCTAAIALVDAALVRPAPDGLPMLRSLFGGAGSKR